jgi:hypothetical protein
MAGGTGAIVGWLLGLMLADHVFRNYRSFAEENVTFDRDRHGYGHGGPGHFFSC